VFWRPDHIVNNDATCVPDRIREISRVPIFDHFDILAPLYETFIPPKDPQEIWALAELPVDGALLDAGGGTGRVAQYMTGKAAPVVVADLSYSMLAEARQKEGLRPVSAHTEKLPFADETFARIIMVDALHHVCDQRATADELWRTLQPGGRIVIEEPDVRTFVVKLLALAEKVALMRSHFLSPPRIAALFDHPNARVRVEAGEFNAWVIVGKEIKTEL
jgi:2-polyprenyl-3-methyl-5-hydroxy-6-metoxy-1,4-benzoquinol methylase